jgi:hypothetical protein
MDTPQDTLEVSFSNNTSSEQFICKIFYDYEEVKFKVLNQSTFDTSFVFNLKEANSINIPFQLDKAILRDNKSHKLTIGIYASPEKNAKTRKLMTNFYGMTMDYEVYYETSGKISLKKQESKTIKTLDNINFEGLVINNKISNKSDEVLFPPYSIKVKKGEKIELAYFTNLTNSIPETVENYLILSMLDWKQIQMSGHPYLLLDQSSLSTDSRTFYITAPDKEGLYDFTAFIVPNPDHSKNEDNFFPIDHAYRFTIEVVK